MKATTYMRKSLYPAQTIILSYKFYTITCLRLKNMKKNIISLLILLIALISICTVSASTDADNFNAVDSNMEDSDFLVSVDSLEDLDVQATQDNYTNADTDEIDSNKLVTLEELMVYIDSPYSPTIDVVDDNFENGLANFTVLVQNFGNGLANQTILLEFNNESLHAITDDEGYAHFLNVNIKDTIFFNFIMANNPSTVLTYGYFPWKYLDFPPFELIRSNEIVRFNEIDSRLKI